MWFVWSTGPLFTGAVAEPWACGPTYPIEARRVFTGGVAEPWALRAHRLRAGGGGAPREREILRGRSHRTLGALWRVLPEPPTRLDAADASSQDR